MPKQALRLLTFLPATLLFPLIASAQRLYVDDSAQPGGNGSSWSSALRNLDVALTQASSGEVWVAEGRYLAPQDGFVLPNRVLVYGGFAGTETSPTQRELSLHSAVLDGDQNGDDALGFFADNSDHVVRDTGVGHTQLDGFVVRGGRIRPGKTGAAGGSFQAPNVSLSNLVFEDNDCIPANPPHRPAAALAFFNTTLGAIELRGCVLRNNGSGLVLQAETFDSIEILGSTFERHNGAVGINAPVFGDVYLQGCTFLENEQTAGGAISISTEAGGNVTLLDSTFRRNSSTAGSGFFLHTGSDAHLIPLTIQGCLFEDNFGCAGPAIYTNAGPTLVSSCVFRNNHPLPNCGLGTGGALRVEFSAARVVNSSFSGCEIGLAMAKYGADLVLEQCTFSNVGLAAPSIQLDRGTTADFQNCIVWGDATDQLKLDFRATLAIVTASYSDLHRGGVPMPGTGNIDADPLFLDAASGDLRLRTLSPCLDAGDPAPRPNGADVERYSRITDGNLDRVLRLDMGAHEASPARLDVTGTFAPGGTLTFTASGRPGLATTLWIDRPGMRFVPRVGTLFMAGQGLFRSTWPSAPSSVPITVPPGVTGLYHAQLVVQGASGAVAFSNYVPLQF